MDQIVLSQYAHRVGCTLPKGSFCDGCRHVFEYGEMAFRCLECSGFICPGSTERTLIQTEVTTHHWLQSGGTQWNILQTTPYSGYDLCLDCAKKPFLHSHHHFTMTICRA